MRLRSPKHVERMTNEKKNEKRVYFSYILQYQVLTFLSHRGYLNNTQHCFRSGRSCLSVLLDVYGNIMHMINNKSTVNMI